ncbi:hypothetical protein JCGZ_17473 [Jatropha curcas]|uniref:Uncharacterized protein n=1 Tax=Jatropha curcas TaxID=180498 RepID=A0A067L9K7_JATCU|nr:hypothetical protein JCGZ_17473 [Jatropha curcas]
MRRVFGVKKDKEPPPSIQDASDRINKRGDSVEEKIKKLDAELTRYREQIKKTRPGPAQEAIKARAMRVLKQKRINKEVSGSEHHLSLTLKSSILIARSLSLSKKNMRRVFGVKKDKEPPPSIQDASDRINKRGDSVEEKIQKLDAELTRYREQIKKARPGPAQEAIKARALRGRALS